MKEYNDNELLYLLSENDEFAFDMLMEKYQPMIITRLQRYHVKSDYWDDYFQECVILLYKCAISYREDITKTFNRYYDKLLQYLIQNLMRRDRQSFYRVVLMSMDEIDNIPFYRVEEKKILTSMDDKPITKEDELIKMVCDGVTIKEIAESNDINYYQAYNLVRKVKSKREFREKKKSPFSSLEANIYELFKTGYRPGEIASLLSINPSTVYNAMKRIRSKQKSFVKKYQVEKMVDKGTEKRYNIP